MRMPSATYSLSLLAPLVVSIPLAGMGAGPAGADTDTSPRPAVEVNLDALKSSGPQLNLPTRIIDGSSVIVLTPPSLQKKSPAPSQKIVKPLVKPALTLPETTVTAAAPVPVPPVNPAKLPDPAEDEKFEDVATPVVKMDTAPIPTPEAVEETKEDVAAMATEKVTETASVSSEPADQKLVEAATDPAPEEITTPPTPDVAETETKPEAAEEIKLAAIAPDAGPPATAASSDLNDNLTRILFAEGKADLPAEARLSLQEIAEQVKKGERQNVQLLAYGSGNSVSAARRLSLGRALAVRSKLMELGVENRQIEVRALGQPKAGGPSDRVDLLLISR